MFKHYSKKVKTCDTCGQIVSSTEYLIGDEELISYNEKTGTWIVKRLENGNTKA